MLRSDWRSGKNHRNRRNASRAKRVSPTYHLMALEGRVLLSATGPVMIAQPLDQPSTIGDGAAPSISGTVFYDNNEASPVLQGVKTNADDGIPFVEVDLEQPVAGSANANIIESAVTDQNGQFTFSDLGTGQYFLNFVPPPTYTISPTGQNRNITINSVASQTTGQSPVLVLGANTTDNYENCGMYSSDTPPYIGGTVFNDENGNGVIDTGEPGIQGATVILYNIQALEPPQTTVTDAMGHYNFTPVVTDPDAPNLTLSYLVQFELPNGFGFYSPEAVTARGPSVYSWADPTSGNTDEITVLHDTAQTDVNCGFFAPDIAVTGPTNAVTVDGVKGILRPTSGFADADFSVTISPAVPADTTVQFTTTDGTAVAGVDYVAQTGTLDFPESTAAETDTVVVQVIGNTVPELNVTFHVDLTTITPDAYNITAGRATCTIINQNFPTATVIGGQVTRPDTGTVNLPFTINLSETAPFEVDVPYNTADYSAVSGTDYTATSGTAVFAPGVTSQVVNVPVIGGTNPENDKQFLLVLGASTTTAAVTTPTEGVGTILTNSTPQLTLIGGTVTESLLGTTQLPFIISIAPALTESVVVQYATSDGTAVAGLDYGATSGTITFGPGQTQQTVDVPVYRRFVAQQDKTVNMTISTTSTNVTVPTPTAVGTIVDIGTVAVPFSSKQKAVYTDYLNNPVTVSMRGPGSGTLVFIGTTSTATNAYEILMEGSTSASSLQVVTRHNLQTSFENILITGSAQAITARSANILGLVTASGSVNTISLNFLQKVTMTIGAGTGTLSLAFGSVLDTTITSAIPIKQLTALAYLNTDGVQDTLTAPTIGTIKVKGSFQGVLVQTQAVASVQVGGSIDGSTIRSTGSIGAVSASSITGSLLLAGISSSISALPTSTDDFVNQSASIASVHVNAGAFSNTVIAGWKIGMLSLGAVQSNNGGTIFGVSGDRIASVLASAAMPIRMASLTNQSNSLLDDDFTVRAV